MSDPNTRAVSLQWNNNAMAGDELLELWRKTDSVWALDIAVAVSPISPQSHSFSLLPGTSYSFQIRARRDGGYRAGYTSLNPEDWPVGSRLNYTTGLPVPVLSCTGWARTSAIAEHLTLAWSNHDSSRATRVWRDAGSGFALVQTVGVGIATYDYPIAGGEGETTLTFYVDQVDDATNPGPGSNHVARWAGPAAPTALVQTSDPYLYGYDAGWALGQSGVQTRLNDHYTGAYADRTLSATDDVFGSVTGLPQSSIMFGPSHDVPVIVRARHEVTAFAVTDVSDWTVAAVNFSVIIYDDETDYHGP